MATLCSDMLVVSELWKSSQVRLLTMGEPRTGDVNYAKGHDARVSRAFLERDPDTVVLSSGPQARYGAAHSAEDGQRLSVPSPVRSLVGCSDSFLFQQ